MFHHITAVAAVSSLTTANGFLTVAAGLTDSDLSSLNVSPNFSFFPFMELVQNMVGGLWAMSLYIAIAAWICAAIAWIMGRVIHSGPMQQYSGTVFNLVRSGDDDPGQFHGDREVLRDAGAVLKRDDVLSIRWVPWPCHGHGTFPR